MYMTWKLWLLSCNLLLVASAGAMAQDTTGNEHRGQHLTAPYYDEFGDIIYPKHDCRNEAVHWVRLYDALTNRRRIDTQGAPTWSDWIHEVRAEQRRQWEESLMSARLTRQLSRILTDYENQVLEQHQMTRMDRRTSGDNEECDAGTATAVPQQHPAAWGTMLHLRGVRDNPHGLSRPCGCESVPSGADPVRLHRRHNVWRVSVIGIEARADRVTLVDDNQLLLEGNVVLEVNQPNQPAKILAERALINVKYSTYEVMP
jgi:hypothetical protein